MDDYQQTQTGRGPVGGRVRDFISDPKLIGDMKFVLPMLIGLFALVYFLKSHAGGMLYLLTTASSAIVIYFMLDKLNLKNYVTVDLYRAVLFLGVIFILVGAPAGSTGQTAHSAPAISRVEVQSTVANIRKSPTTDSDVVAQARNGDTLKVLKEKNSWYKVETSSGETGWVYSNLVNDSSVVSASDRRR